MADTKKRKGRGPKLFIKQKRGGVGNPQRKRWVDKDVNNGQWTEKGKKETGFVGIAKKKHEETVGFGWGKRGKGRNSRVTEFWGGKCQRRMESEKKTNPVGEQNRHRQKKRRNPQKTCPEREGGSGNVFFDRCT